MNAENSIFSIKRNHGRDAHAKKHCQQRAAEAGNAVRPADGSVARGGCMRMQRPCRIHGAQSLVPKPKIIVFASFQFDPEAAKEKNSLVRSCRLKINGGTIITPSRAISVTKSNIEELKVSSTLIDNQFLPFGEVFIRVPLDFLSKLIDDDIAGQKFSSLMQRCIYDQQRNSKRSRAPPIGKIPS